jgi:hypothetical protein
VLGHRAKAPAFWVAVDGVDGQHAVDGVRHEDLGGGAQVRDGQRPRVVRYSVLPGGAQDRGPGGARQVPAVGGRRAQRAIDDGEHAGPVGLKHAPVGVGDQQLLPRGQAGLGGEVGEQAAVLPLVFAEAAGDDRRAQGDAGRAGRQRDDLDAGLERAADRAHGDPQPPCRPPGQACGQVSGQRGG